MPQGSRSRIQVKDDFMGFFGATMGTTALPIGMNGVMYTSVNEGSFATTVDETGGVLKVTTDTADNDNCCLYVGPFDVQGSPWMEARVKCSDITTDAMFVGFQTTVDATTPVMGAEFATATMTINEAASLIGAQFDSDGTTDLWRAICADNGVAVSKDSDGTTSTNGVASVAPVNDEWDVIRVSIDSSGGGEVWHDGSLVAAFDAGSLTTTDLIYAVVIIENRSAAASIMEVDYIDAEGYRDWTV